MERLWKDIRFALRTFTKAPAFALTAVGSLALGIGVNTTIFTIINALFLNPLPVDRVSEVVAVYTVDTNNTSQLGNVLQVSLPNYRDFRDRSQSFSAMAAYSFPMPGSLSTGGEGEQIFMELVTGNYFSTLGVRPLSGRVIGPERRPCAGRVAGHRARSPHVAAPIRRRVRHRRPIRDRERRRVHRRGRRAGRVPRRELALRPRCVGADDDVPRSCCRRSSDPGWTSGARSRSTSRRG